MSLNALLLLNMGYRFHGFDAFLEKKFGDLIPPEDLLNVLTPITGDNISSGEIIDDGSIPPSKLTHNSGGISWEVTASSKIMAVNTGYIANSTSLITLTLPTISDSGDVLEVVTITNGSWKIAQNASQTIHFGNQDTTTGAAGYLSSLDDGDTIRMVCIVASIEWKVIGSQGNITVI
jgi:hypothetical protein